MGEELVERGRGRFRFDVKVALDDTQMAYLLGGVKSHKWDDLSSGLRMALNEKMQQGGKT